MDVVDKEIACIYTYMGEKKEIFLKYCRQDRPCTKSRTISMKARNTGGLILILLHCCNSNGFNELLHETEKRTGPESSLMSFALLLWAHLGQMYHFQPVVRLLNILNKQNSRTCILMCRKCTHTKIKTSSQVSTSLDFCAAHQYLAIDFCRLHQE